MRCSKVEGMGGIWGFYKEVEGMKRGRGNFVVRHLFRVARAVNTYQEGSEFIRTQYVVTGKKPGVI